MSRALEIVQTRFAQLATLQKGNSPPPGNSFIDPRLEPEDVCAKRPVASFSGVQISLISAPLSERKIAVSLANMLHTVSTAEMSASVIPKGIQAIHRYVTRRQVIAHPVAPAVISQSVELVAEERIYVSGDNDLAITRQSQSAGELHIITGSPKQLSTAGFKSLDDTLAEIVKKAA